MTSYGDNEKDAKEWEVFGVAAKGSRGLLWVAITLCDESLVESECCEEEVAGVDDNAGE